LACVKHEIEMGLVDREDKELWWKQNKL
jgi:hypothetical protein